MLGRAPLQTWLNRSDVSAGTCLRCGNDCELGPPGRLGHYDLFAARPDNGRPSRCAEDTESTYRSLVAAGVAALAESQVWLDRLLIAWILDPDDHPIQLVQALDRGTSS
jgi:hypothetical protein